MPDLGILARGMCVFERKTPHANMPRYISLGTPARRTRRAGRPAVNVAVAGGRQVGPVGRGPKPRFRGTSSERHIANTHAWRSERARPAKNHVLESASPDHQSAKCPKQPPWRSEVGGLNYWRKNAITSNVLGFLLRSRRLRGELPLLGRPGDGAVTP
jgi:hypothetical protein